MAQMREAFAARTVAVVGAGFSGLLTAIHLLRHDPGVRVHLIERSEAFGRGRAYATANPHHLLNVRAANMSAFPDDPDHFHRWLATAPGEAFVTRGRYGDYLRAILETERRQEGSRLVLHHGLAVSATGQGARGWRLGLADGRSIAADALVLALGFLDPAPATAPQGVGHPLHIADPWASDLGQAPDGDILLLGTGLTMVDVALALDSPRRRITAISRRGLMPLVHGPAVPAPAPDPMSTPLGALRRLRRHAAALGWRGAIDSVREITPATWQSWSARERRQFLRHLRPWWDIHRHRMAPAIAERVAAMRCAGRLEVQAAKIGAVVPAGPGLEVAFRPRGREQDTRRRFAAMIDCTSSRNDVDRIDAGLIADLRRQGLLRADALGLGLDMGPDWTVLGADGRPTPGLFAVGPLARSAVWETVAVPDLRRHAQQAAAAVCGFLTGPRTIALGNGFAQSAPASRPVHGGGALKPKTGRKGQAS